MVKALKYVAGFIKGFIKGIKNGLKHCGSSFK